MMFDWIDGNFQKYIGDSYIVYENEGGFITCSGTWLADKLSNCSMPPTYEELTSLPLASKGWQKIFDQWKNRGIVT